MSILLKTCFAIDEVAFWFLKNGIRNIVITKIVFHCIIR